jgi:hypothetical protein
VVAGFLLLLAMIAWPVWEGREQWNFGQFGDDGVYMVTAKSLAQGDGYRVLNLPGQPYAVKYPPLYPAFLSLSWRVQPHFPDILRLAALMQALLIPFELVLMLAVLRQLGLSWVRTFWVAATTIVTPPMVLMDVTLFAEPLFFCLLFAAIWMIQQSADRDTKLLALGGGLLTGLAYLSRNAALPMLGAAPLVYFLRKKPKLAAWFLLLALPICAGWHVWTFTHGGLGAKGTNASYLNEYVNIMRITGVWANLWKQIGAVSGAVAENLFPGIIGLLAGLPLFHIAFAAAIAGNVRMVLRRGWSLYVVFAIPYLVMVFFWWFEGVARLILPICPLLAAGIAEEVSHLVELAGKNMQVRGRAILRWAVVVLGFLIVVRTRAAAQQQVNSLIREDHQELADDMPAFLWLAENVRDDTVVLTWKDSTAYLYSDATTSRSHFVDLMPLTAEYKAVALPQSTLPAKYERGMLVLLKSDFSGLDDRAFRSAAEALPESKLAFSSPGSAIYSFKIVR